MSFRFIHVVENGKISLSLRLNNISLWIYIPSSLSTYLSDYEILFQYFSCPSLKETLWNLIFIYFGSWVEMHIISAPSCVMGIQMCSQEATVIQVFLCFFHPPVSLSLSIWKSSLRTWFTYYSPFPWLFSKTLILSLLSSLMVFVFLLSSSSD